MPPKEVNKAQRAYDNGATLAAIIETCTKAEVTTFINEKGMGRPFKEVVAALEAGPTGGVGEDEVTDIKVSWADSELQQIAETVSNLVTFTPVVKVAVNRLTNFFSRHNIPQIVTEYVVSRGQSQYTIFLDYIRSIDGTVSTRKRHRSEDYTFLVSVFTVWAVWATPSFRDNATSGGLVNTKLLLEMAERMFNVLNGETTPTVSKKGYSGDLALALRTWKSSQQAVNRQQDNRSQYAQPPTSHGRRTETPGRGGHVGGRGTTVRGGARGRGGGRIEGCYLCGDFAHNKVDCPKLGEARAKGPGG